MEALSRPLFKKVPEDREVREGNTVRFDTLISGRPAPELVWFNFLEQWSRQGLHDASFFFQRSILVFVTVKYYLTNNKHKYTLSNEWITQLKMENCPKKIL
jgi:hypothetical protein